MTQFPFSAIVAMDDMRLALILNAISPAIGGVLVRGEKGTAKSTAVRALTAVLPPVEVIDGCRFSCDPASSDPRCPDGPHQDRPAAHQRNARLVELPVGATDDRLTGSLDVGRALTEGVTSFQPGLLAAAHRGVLYVDEVNLLHDHLVDLLLDAAALGTSYVERDGVSVRHQARFLLVGTMNPEEGELRPQLLDRFGLTVEAVAPGDPKTRAEVVRRRLAYDADPETFSARFSDDEAGLAAAIGDARQRLRHVVLDDEVLETIAAVCASFGVDGLRADIVIARAAAAHAAWRGGDTVTREDIRAAARLALPHRRRRNPFDAPGLDEQQLDEALGGPEDEPEPPDGGSGGEGDGGGSGGGDGHGDGSGGEGDGSGGGDGGGSSGGDGHGDGSGSGSGSGRETVAAAGATFRARRLEVPGKGHGADGRRSRAYTDGGRTIGARPPKAGHPASDLHLPATLTAAAPHQVSRGRTGPGLILQTTDLRERRREGRESNLILFAVDASGSMAARRRMEAVKGAVLSLLLDAYQRRDKVGLVTFRKDRAELVLPPTSSVDAAARRLEHLPAGGRTPLAAGLAEAHATLRREQLRDPLRRPLLVVVTDGRHTALPRPGSPGQPAPANLPAGPDRPPGGDDVKHAARNLRNAGIASVVVDCETGPVRLGLARALAAELGATCVGLGDLSAEVLTESVRAHRVSPTNQPRPTPRVSPTNQPRPTPRASGKAA